MHWDTLQKGRKEMEWAKENVTRPYQSLRSHYAIAVHDAFKTQANSKSSHHAGFHLLSSLLGDAFCLSQSATTAFNRVQSCFLVVFRTANILLTNHVRVTNLAARPLLLSSSLFSLSQSAAGARVRFDSALLSLRALLA